MIGKMEDAQQDVNKKVHSDALSSRTVDEMEGT